MSEILQKDQIDEFDQQVCYLYVLIRLKLLQKRI